MSDCQDQPVPAQGHFSWNELITTNTQAAAEFYSQLLGWEARPFSPPGMPEGAPPYTMFRTGPDDAMGAGGMMQAMDPSCPPMWVPYVVVADIDQSLAKATDLGAQVLVPVMPVGGVGRIAVIRDPQGATIGLHELSR